MNRLADVDILLVEDNQYDAELAMRAFKKHPYASRVAVVTDGEEALDCIFGRGAYQARQKNSPRVILLDLNLPKVSGLDVLRAIKGDPDTRTIPVVVLTTSQEDSDIVESLRLGANSYIVKPVDFDQFVNAVNHLGYYWLVLNQSPGAP